MSVVLSALWSYAIWACRETEANAVSAQQARKLRDDGWGGVEVLLVDGQTLVNRDPSEMDKCVAACHSAGIPTICWSTPRPHHVPVDVTVALTMEAVQRYGCAGVRYQTEAEFEYSNPAGGGDPVARYSAMEALCAAHRRSFAGPSAVYVRGSLQRADAAWATAWRYGMRAGIETYAVNETPVLPGVPPRPDYGKPAAKESIVPKLTDGWWYRVRLGKAIHLGRVEQGETHVWVPDVATTYRIGSPGGPRQIEGFGDPKWGAVLGFFPGGWLKSVVSAYPHPADNSPAAGVKPTGVELAAEVLAFQKEVKRHGAATKGYTSWAGPEMLPEHYTALAPKNLTGAALLP